MVHELKIYPAFFKDVISGQKTFEIRKNDRPFRKGDWLALNEFDGQNYTGNSCIVFVDYIMNDPDYVKKDMVVMAIKLCSAFCHTKPFKYSFDSVQGTATKLRPCIVDSKRAFFHHWIERITPIIKISVHLPKRELKAFVETIKQEYPILPTGIETIVQKEPLAIVELENGEIREVKPSEIRFCDMQGEEATI